MPVSIWGWRDEIQTINKRKKNTQMCYKVTLIKSFIHIQDHILPTTCAYKNVQQFEIQTVRRTGGSRASRVWNAELGGCNVTIGPDARMWLRICRACAPSGLKKEYMLRKHTATSFHQVQSWRHIRQALHSTDSGSREPLSLLSVWLTTIRQIDTGIGVVWTFR